jgi:hypothetical protein
MSDKLLTLLDLAAGLQTGQEISSFIGRKIILTTTGTAYFSGSNVLAIPAEGMEYKANAECNVHEIHPALHHILTTKSNLIITGQIKHMEMEARGDRQASLSGSLLPDYNHVKMTLSGVKLQSIDSLRELINKEQNS